MAYFPLFIELESAPCLIIGGGQVALRKLEKLLPYGPAITIVAEDFLPDFDQFSQVDLQKRSFTEADLEGKTLVIAATDDEMLNAKIAKACQALKTPVNVVDDKEKCSFLFPSLVKRGPLSIGISSAGSSPSAAKYFRALIEGVLPSKAQEEGFGTLLSGLAEQRDYIKERIGDEKTRARCFELSFQRALQLGRAPEQQELEDIIAEVLEKEAGKGHVTLLGAGCGSKEWLTLRGLHAILSCDVIVYDALIDKEILNINPDAERYLVGKRCGKHSQTQEEINSLLIKLAEKGLKVLRLKGGDPFVFGRGGEEALALQEAGITCDYIPGISSAIAIPGEAGIPITHRRTSRAFHVMTAHTADELGALVEDAENLANLEGTLIFLMGLSRLEEIVTGLMEAGKPASTPVAVVSGGNSEHPECVRGVMSDISTRVQESGVRAPAIIVVGDVAALNLFSS